MKLENEFLAVEFSCQGIPVGLLDKKTSHQYLGSEGACRGWKIVSPSGKWLDCPIEQEQQEVSISPIQNGFQFHCSSLKRDAETYDVRISICYELVDDQLESRFEIENRDAVTITELWFP